MKSYFAVEKIPVYLKFFIALILLFSVKDLSSIDSFSKLAVTLLEFII